MAEVICSGKNFDGQFAIAIAQNIKELTNKDLGSPHLSKSH